MVAVFVSAYNHFNFDHSARQFASDASANAFGSQCKRVFFHSKVQNNNLLINIEELEGKCDEEAFFSLSKFICCLLANAVEKLENGFKVMHKCPQFTGHGAICLKTVECL